LSRPGAVERAIAALRTGRAVRIEGAEPLALVSIETATPELLEIVDPKGQAPLLISGRRAVALSLANERDAADPAQPVLLAREPWLDAASAMTLADPAQDFARSPMGPLRPLHLQAAEPARAALALARGAGLLPALWVVDDAERRRLRVHSRSARERCAPERYLACPAPAFRSRTCRTRRFSPFAGRTTVRIMSRLLVGAFGGKPPLCPPP
jgi:GTP cyclohydrolase II